ncbi:ABC transporter permease [Isobaculum melis]|uniref:Transport permease protein n=1 Tax=Isobaculum melis TaxID=142588 RepID=A0A1H9UCD0_9LACT|nr:ABC transporter permease [Isobaculum melis]SES06918.1 ABC-2 type transport system permease protein [Isobaculum melis]
MYRFLRIVQRDTINLLINPMWIFFGIGFPFLLTAVLGVLTEGLYGSSITSYDYYGVTMLLYSTLYAATFSANAFLEERIKQPNLRIIYSPINKFSIPLSKIIATFIFTAIFYTLAGGVMHILLGVNFGSAHLGKIMALFLAVDFFFSCIGVLMCCLFKSEGVANQIISIVTTLFAVLSGLFFPVASLGKQMVAISKFSPITKVIDLIFSLIYDTAATGFLATMGLLLGMSMLLILCCGALFKGEDYL